MENVLKRLLEVETQAEEVIAAADTEQKRVIDAALEEARLAEVRFLQDIERRREPLMVEAEQRAEQLVAGLARKYEDRKRALRDLADRNEKDAVATALKLLLDPDA